MNKDLLEESTKDQSAKYFFYFSSFQVFKLVLPIELVLGRAHSQLEFANKYRVMKKDKKIQDHNFDSDCATDSADDIEILSMKKGFL